MKNLSTLLQLATPNDTHICYDTIYLELSDTSNADASNNNSNLSKHDSQIDAINANDNY